MHLANSDMHREIDPKSIATRATVWEAGGNKAAWVAQGLAIVVKLRERRVEQADHLNLPTTSPLGCGCSPHKYAEVQHVRT